MEEKQFHCRLEAPTEVLKKYIVNEEFDFNLAIPKPDTCEDPYWNIDNWGTRYNAIDTDYDSDLPDFRYVEFDVTSFPPLNVICKIFDDNPDECLRFEWRPFEDTHEDPLFSITRNEMGYWQRTVSWKE